MTLIEAIENAKNAHCLYGIIIMPMHEERHTASFHILHGKTEGQNQIFNLILTNLFVFRTS